MTPKIRLTLWVAVVLPAVHATAAVAGATEAAKLNAALTPMGAERAGNADGSIPAWSGGGDPDVFAGDKPRFSITARNMAQHADKLSDGDKALLTKYPATYRIDVYPTRRTASAPQWVYDRTARNAATAAATDGGNGIKGAFGGAPFPLPRTGAEVMWNHLLSWEGVAASYSFAAWTVTADGRKVLGTEADQLVQHPYYDIAREAEWNGDYLWLKQTATGPSFKVGHAVLLRDNVDPLNRRRQAWEYLTGQRRVRKAPVIAYDTPDLVISGIGNVDEAFVFMGALDRYDWKILGKKELYVPYNNNRLTRHGADEALGPQHLNPDLVRFELHRVWVVEGTLANGKRHVTPRRRYYVDEDCWCAVSGDSWDAEGKLWKHYYGLTLLVPEIPALVNSVNWGLYNFQSGSYVLNNAQLRGGRHYKAIAPQPEGAFSADALAGAAVR